MLPADGMACFTQHHSTGNGQNPGCTYEVVSWVAWLLALVGAVEGWVVGAREGTSVGLPVGLAVGVYVGT